MPQHYSAGPDWHGVLVVSEFPRGAWARFLVGLGLGLLPAALVHYFYGFCDANDTWKLILLGITWALGGSAGVVLGTLFAAAPSLWGPLSVCAQVLIICGGFAFGTFGTAFYLDGTNLKDQLTFGPRPVRGAVAYRPSGGELYRHVAELISGAGGFTGLGVGVAAVWLVKRAIVLLRPPLVGTDCDELTPGEAGSWGSTP
jgi:hypothetical protein